MNITNVHQIFTNTFHGSENEHENEHNKVKIPHLRAEDTVFLLGLLTGINIIS